VIGVIHSPSAIIRCGVLIAAGDTIQEGILARGHDVVAKKGHIVEVLEGTVLEAPVLRALLPQREQSA
jgi:hypothetical protein